jgi:uncharacterized protein
MKRYYQGFSVKTRLKKGLTPALLCLSLTGILTAGCGKPSHAGPERTDRSAFVWADSDLDGIPDAAELSSFDDRENFRRWFTSIAEMQFYQLSDAWNGEQRDCPGLVRFAWREALRRHDRQWYQYMSGAMSTGGEGYEPVAPDVRAYTLDRSPLGEKLFRIDAGSFDQSDLTNARFSEFADARVLKNYNLKFVSRERRDLLRPGDLVFFHQPWVQKYPYHVMIFLGEARYAAEGSSDWVVYHTGSSPLGLAKEGEMKKVRLATLDHHPDKRWRPVENNQNFLGFYRLKILE